MSGMTRGEGWLNAQKKDPVTSAYCAQRESDTTMALNAFFVLSKWIHVLAPYYLTLFRGRLFIHQHCDNFIEWPKRFKFCR